MIHPWTKVAVVVFWAGTFSWLLGSKVLPSFFLGEPPNYRRVADARRNAPPLGWALYINENRVGWAFSASELLPGGFTEFRNRVRFEQLQLDELAPGWVNAIVRTSNQPLGRFDLDAKSSAVVDTFGNLVQLSADLGCDGVARLVHVDGAVVGRALKVAVQTGEFKYETEYLLPPDVMISDAFSPQVDLPGLQVGQRWQVRSSNPFRPHEPLETMWAEVTGVEPLLWNGRMENTFLVAYSRERGYGADREHPAVGRAWVRPNGAVLRQELQIFDATVAFERLNSEETDRLRQEMDAMVQGLAWPRPSETTDVPAWKIPSVKFPGWKLFSLKIPSFETPAWKIPFGGSSAESSPADPDFAEGSADAAEAGRASAHARTTAAREAAAGNDATAAQTAEESHAALEGASGDRVDAAAPAAADTRTNSTMHRPAAAN